MKITAALLALCLFTASTAPALALSGPWEETDGGRMRIVLGPVDKATGTARGFLDIDLLPGWKTYWREPGFSGIPPSISVADSLNVDGLDLRFPAPQWLETADGNFAGYASPVRFPFTVSLADGEPKGMLNAAVFVGICKDICIPATGQFILPLRVGEPDSDAAAIAAAFDTLPDLSKIVASPGERHDDGSVDVRLDWPQNTLQAPVLFAADAAAKVTFSHPELVSAEAGRAVFRVKPARPGKAQTIETVLTLVTGNTAHEIIVPLDFPDGK